MNTVAKSPWVTVNPCRPCAPLGAALALRGIEGALPFIHGSQGCATYIRRYLISHYREPVDIASSSIAESNAIFGGEEALVAGLDALVRQYSPALIGVATSCLSETIGDDVKAFCGRYTRTHPHAPTIVPVSTPAYSVSHEDAFHATIGAVVQALADGSRSAIDCALFPPALSPADCRLISALCTDFGFRAALVPDTGESLDGGTWERYEAIPPGGTPITVIKGLGTVPNAIELGAGAALRDAGQVLRAAWNRNVMRLPVPVGVNATDRFCHALADISGNPLPDRYAADRMRLIDAMVDGHKYLSGKRALIVGDQDTVAALAAWCAEVGIHPAVCVTGPGSGRLREAIASLDCEEPPQVIDDADFDTVADTVVQSGIDLCLGPSKCFSVTRTYGIPLVRIGFPIHDRFGAARCAMTCYTGSLALFDRVVNTLIEAKQDPDGRGYSYL